MSCSVISQWIFSNHIFTYLWNYIYENLVVKSVSLNLFSLLVSSSPSSVDVSSFGCVGILSMYLALNFVISSLIVGTFKSVCLTLLDIDHGAFTFACSTLFWYHSNISMFEILTVPQRGIPYVQMGFRIVLYISNLFSFDFSEVWKEYGLVPSHIRLNSLICVGERLTKFRKLCCENQNVAQGSSFHTAVQCMLWIDAPEFWRSLAWEFWTRNCMHVELRRFNIMPRHFNLDSTH
jgi:hypothetical protein